MTSPFSAAGLHAIETFAQRVGVAAVPAPDGTYSFAFERSGTLSFVPAAEGRRLILALLHTPPYPDPQSRARVRKLAGDDRPTARPLHATTTAEGTVVLAFTLDDDEIDPPTVLACIDRLIDVQEELA